MASKIQAGRGSASIGVGPGGGDVLSVAIMPLGTSEGPWWIAISAKLPNGSITRVGTVFADARSSATSSSLSQVVAGAYCPDAREWFLDFKSDKADAAIIVSGSTSKACGVVAHRAWAWSVRADGVDADDAPKIISALSDSFRIGAPAWRFDAWGTSTDATARYVVVLDQATAPVLGNPTIDGVRAPANASWTLPQPHGERHVNGLVVAYSDTLATYTPPVAGAPGLLRVGYLPIQKL